MKKILSLLLFVATISSCSSLQNSGNASTVSLNGTIQKMGVTTYQYGTHTINYGGKPYALKSSSLNLDTYIDKQVTLTGSKVEGYPVDGGPELIDVSEVVVK